MENRNGKGVVGFACEAVSVTAFPANPYFLPGPGKHEVTLTSFTAGLSELASFPLVRMCELGDREGTESLAVIRMQLREISQKIPRGGGAKDSPPSCP